MVFGKLSSQLTGNKAGRSKTASSQPANTSPPPHRRQSGTVMSMTASDGSSARSATELERKTASGPALNSWGRTATPASTNGSSPRESALSAANMTASVEVEPVVRGAGRGVGRGGGGMNSCVRHERKSEHQTGSPENPLIDDLLAELESSPSDLYFTAPNQGKKDATGRRDSHSKNAATGNRRWSELDDGDGAVADKNAPRDLNIAELTRGSSFEGFDAQGFARRRSSDAPSSVGRRQLPGGKEALDTIATASQHFVHVLRMHEMESYFSAADNTQDDTVKKLLGKKSPQEVENLVVSLMDILEQVRVARGKIGAMRGSFSQLGLIEKRAMSASVFSTMSTASLARPPVHETTSVAMAYDRQGNKMINRYTVLADLGQGAYGKVKLGREGDSGNQVAIKIIDKKHLKKKLGGPGSSSDNALKREIAIMKKVRHRNCVSLYEVIDDPGSNKLYLIMDYVPNGPVVRLKHQNLMPYLLRAAETRRVVNGVMYNVRAIRFCVRNRLTDIDVPLSEEEIMSQPSCFCCRPLTQSVCALYLRQLVSGLRYMHKRNVVHHDIKPDNILLGVDHHVFLTDFGVSEILQKKATATSSGKDDGSDENSQDGSSPGEHGGKSGRGGGGGARLGGGTLLFTAPELVDPNVDQSTVDPYATDVWALGVTLYCMLFGFAPFTGRAYGEVVRNVREADLFWSEASLIGTPLLPEWREILTGMLAKQPAKRWTLVKLKEYLDSQAFHLALQTASMEASGGAEADLGVSLSFGKPVSNPTTPGAAVNGDAKCARAGSNDGGALTPGGPSPGSANNTFPSMTRVSSISTSHLHSFSSSLQPVSTSAVPLSPFAGVSASGGQVVPPAALTTSAAQAAERGTPSGGINQNKYMPWDMGVSEQDVREACLTVQVDMIESDPHEASAHTKALVHRYVQHIRDSIRPQQRLFSATPRVKKTSSQMRAELDAEFGRGTPDNAGDDDDVLTDSEDDPLGAPGVLSGRWPRVRTTPTMEGHPEQESSSHSSEVPLVPVAGTFHRVTDSPGASPRTPGKNSRHGSGTHASVPPPSTANTAKGDGGDGGAPLPGHGLSVNPNTNTRPLSRRRAGPNAAHALLCGSQSLDAMLSIVDLQSEGVSGASSDTSSAAHGDDEDAMGPRAFARTRLPSEGTESQYERKFLSISHATPDVPPLKPAGTEGATNRKESEFSNIREPSVEELRKAVGPAGLSWRQRSAGSATTPVSAAAAAAKNAAAGSSPSPAARSPSDAGPSRATPRQSLSCSPRPSTRKPVAVQKLASASAPGHLPSAPRHSSSVADTKRATLAGDSDQIQRQLSSGKDRRAATLESSLVEIAVPSDGQSTSTKSAQSSGIAVLTAWERKSRR